MLSEVMSFVKDNVYLIAQCAFLNRLNYELNCAVCLDNGEKKEWRVLTLIISKKKIICWDHPFIKMNFLSNNVFRRIAPI